jgi:UrcA family protein
MSVATLALTMTLGVAPVVQAGDATAPGVVRTQVVVDYADLDLDSVAGNKTLYARLSQAAERACGPEPQGYNLRAQSKYRHCHEAALTKAVDRIGSPELQALHSRQSAGGVG